MVKLDKNQTDELKKALELADISALLKILENFEKEVRDDLVEAMGSKLNDTKKQRVLNKVKSRVGNIDPQVRSWVTNGVSAVYVNGLNTADEMLDKFGMETKAGKLSIQVLRNTDELKPHLSAVNALISESYNDFGNTMNGIVRNSERLLSETLKRQVRQELAQGRLTGKGAREIAREVRKTIGDQGFTVLRDRGGRRWSLKSYSEMVSRTNLSRANNEAIINRALDFDVDIVEVSDHGTDTPICQRYEGNIYSISGQSKKYPKLPVNAPFHPNCKHRILLRPDLK